MRLKQQCVIEGCVDLHFGKTTAHKSEKNPFLMSAVLLTPTQD